MHRIAVVIPVFNEAAVLRQMAEKLLSVLEDISVDWNVVFVNDGSSDGSVETILSLALQDKRYSMISLSRNYGHQIAITAGLDLVRCDAAIVIDCDLQDPPHVINDFTKEWMLGSDIVVGVRRKRLGDSFLKRFTASIYYAFLGHIGDRDTFNSGDFRLYSKRAICVLRAIRERQRYLRGLSSWVGLRQSQVLYDRNPRVAGVTKYTVSKMLSLAWAGVASSNTTASSCLGLLGVMTLVFGIAAMSAIALGITLANYSQFLTAAIITLLGIALFTQALSIKYLTTIYDEARARPLYVVDRIVNIEVFEPIPGGVVILPECPAPSTTVSDCKKDSLLKPNKPSKARDLL